MENLAHELDMAVEFVKATWIAVIMGGYDAPPGAPQLRFDTIDQRRKYADSIILGDALDMPESGLFSRTVLSTEQISERTEQGQPPWDMKPMLLHGPKARYSKKGTLYNIIPFRHGVPGKSGANAHFQNMPKDIYEAAKKLKASLSATHITMNRVGEMGNRLGIMRYGGKINQAEHGHLLKPPKTKYFFFTTPEGGYGAGKYTHKADIHEGMIKVQASYAKGSQSKYLTFRCVSDKSDPHSWWHPGRQPQPHLQFISNYCQPRIEERLKEAAINDLMRLDGVGITVTRT
jgi:hypothetical protein